MFRWSLPAAIIAGLMAFVLGGGIVLFGSDCRPAAETFSTDTHYLAWAILVGLSFVVGLWAAVHLGLIYSRLSWSFRNHISTPVSLTLVVLVLSIGVGGRLAGSQAFPPEFCAMGTRLTLIMFGGLALAVPGVMLLDAVRQAGGSLKGHRLEVALLLRLRRALDQAAIALGLFFAVALLGTAALRDAVIGASGRYESIRLLLFGLEFSALILVFYWPAYSFLVERARSIRDSTQPRPNLRDPELKAKEDIRRAVDAMLGIGSTPLESFQARLSIAAPLVTSLLASLVTG